MTPGVGECARETRRQRHEPAFGRGLGTRVPGARSTRSFRLARGDTSRSRPRRSRLERVAQRCWRGQRARRSAAWARTAPTRPRPRRRRTRRHPEARLLQTSRPRAPRVLRARAAGYPRPGRDLNDQCSVDRTWRMAAQPPHRRNLWTTARPNWESAGIGPGMGLTRERRVVWSALGRRTGRRRWPVREEIRSTFVLPREGDGHAPASRDFWMVTWNSGPGAKRHRLPTKGRSWCRVMPRIHWTVRGSTTTRRRERALVRPAHGRCVRDRALGQHRHATVPVETFSGTNSSSAKAGAYNARSLVGLIRNSACSGARPDRIGDASGCTVAAGPIPTRQGSRAVPQHVS